MTMVNTFEKLLGVLVANEVRFILVGGIAVSLNGFLRTTEDMDILVDDAPSNIELLLKCLLQFGQGFARELNISDFPDEEGAIRVAEDFDLDIFVRMRGNKYGDLLGHIRFHETPDGVKVPYLDARGLIKLKAGSGREKDQIDIVALKRAMSQGATGSNADGAKFSLDDLRENSLPSENPND
jgi:hypothetical protein